MLGALAEPHRGLVRGLLSGAGACDPAEPAAVPPLHVLLAVLAEPRRQDLVRLLEHEQLTQRQLVERLGLSQPLLSHHLKVLREAGLVHCDRRGTWVYYRVVPAALTVLAGLLVTGPAG